MANRHLSRTVAVQALYEWDFRRQDSIDDIARRGIETFAHEVDEVFVSTLTRGVSDTVDEIDVVVAQYAPEWPLEQIAVIDKTLLRAAVYELLSMPDTPPKVVINESVELAKTFGGENSAKFVNGVLGTLYRTHPEIQQRVSQEAAVSELPDDIES